MHRNSQHLWLGAAFAAAVSLARSSSSSPELAPTFVGITTVRAYAWADHETTKDMVERRGPAVALRRR